MKYEFEFDKIKSCGWRDEENNNRNCPLDDCDFGCQLGGNCLEEYNRDGKPIDCPLIEIVGKEACEECDSFKYPDSSFCKTDYCGYKYCPYCGKELWSKEQMPPRVPEYVTDFERAVREFKEKNGDKP